MMVDTTTIIESFEQDGGFECFGVFGGAPYFIDTCVPFCKSDVFKYDALSEWGTEIFSLASLPDNIKEAALKAMYKRDTENAEYIADLHSFGERTYTEEKEKAARESRTA